MMEIKLNVFVEILLELMKRNGLNLNNIPLFYQGQKLGKNIFF
jgi:hypothetical protein